MGTGSGLPPEVARRAVEWQVALQSGTATDSMRQAHQVWLLQHPDHQRAWAHIEAVNQRLRGAASASAVVLQATVVRPRSPRRRRAIGALAVTLLAGGAAWQVERQGPLREWLADERTRIGERRTVLLADGSSVVLNTDTAFNVRFTATERRLIIVQGEVLVTTGPDQGLMSGARPFIVETPHGELRPLGTRFAVREQPEASRLDVFEGAVAVFPWDRMDSGCGAQPKCVVRAGQRVRFTRSVISTLPAASETDTAWTDGMLVASGMRLDDFLAELGRYRAGRLSCDPAIAHLRVSGTYPLDNTDRVLALLQVALAVEVQFRTRWWVTVRPGASREKNFRAP